MKILQRLIVMEDVLVDQPIDGIKNQGSLGGNTEVPHGKRGRDFYFSSNCAKSFDSRASLVSLTLALSEIWTKQCIFPK